jgi:hypothetical protein
MLLFGCPHAHVQLPSNDMSLVSTFVNMTAESTHVNGNDSREHVKYFCASGV